MSLIKQALEELDKRGASTQIDEATIRVARTRSAFWLVAAGVVGTLGVGSAAWFMWGTQQRPPLPPVAAAVGARPDALQAVTAQKTAPLIESVIPGTEAPVTAHATRPEQAAIPAPSAVLPGGVNKQPTQISTQQQAENEFHRAYQLMRQGRTTEALAGYEAALALDPGHDLARQAMVSLLLEEKRNADAERVLQEGLEQNPKQYSFAILLARLQVGQNALSQALDTLLKTLPYAEQQPDYQSFVAALLQRQSRHAEAIEHYQKALQLKPQSGVWLMGLGISLRAEQRNADARDAFKRALDSKSLNAELQAYVTQQLKEL